MKASISWFQSASRGDVLISSFLQPFTGEPGQDVSCELNKGISAYSLPERQGSQGWVMMCNLSL